MKPPTWPEYLLYPSRQLPAGAIVHHQQLAQLGRTPLDVVTVFVPGLGNSPTVPMPYIRSIIASMGKAHQLEEAIRYHFYDPHFWLSLMLFLFRRNKDKPIGLPVDTAK